MRRADVVLGVVVAALIAALILVRSGGDRSGSKTTTSSVVASSSAPSNDPLDAFALDPTPIDWSAPPPTTTVTPEGYVGSAACAGCHGDVSARFAEHSMARTGLHRIAGRTPALDALFDGAHAVEHAASGFSYRPMRDEQGYFVEERLDAADGRPLHVRRQPVTLSFTAGVLGTAFGFERGGRLYQVPTDWYPQSKRWALDPGFVQNERFSKTFGVTCLGCHGEYPEHVASNEAIVRGPLAEGIGCERCHGPGARHVETSARGDVVMPSRLPIARQLDLCARCHLEGTAEVMRAGAHTFDYRAGAPLHAHQVQWVEKTPTADWFTLTSASDRLVRSACFVKSKEKLTCTSCHDVHGKAQKPAVERVRDVCLGCHTDRACKAPPDDRRARGDACASCHMARDTPGDFRLEVPGVRLDITDHWIRTRPQTPRPIDARGSSLRVSSIVPWSTIALDEPPSGADLTANETLALVTSGLDEQAFSKLISTASAPPKLAELYRLVGDIYSTRLDDGAQGSERVQLATRLRDARAMEVKLALDDVDVLVRYAKACFMLGSVEAVRDAESALRRALVIVPDDPSALVELGGLLLRTDRLVEATPLFEHAAAVGTDALEAHVVLGALARQKGDARAAARHFEDARRDAPRDRWVLEQLAALYRQLGDHVAEDDVAHALAFVPADARPLEIRRSTRWLPASLRWQTPG